MFLPTLHSSTSLGFLRALQLHVHHACEVTLRARRRGNELDWTTTLEPGLQFLWGCEDLQELEQQSRSRGQPGVAVVIKGGLQLGKILSQRRPQKQLLKASLSQSSKVVKHLCSLKKCSSPR